MTFRQNNSITFRRVDWAPENRRSSPVANSHSHEETIQGLSSDISPTTPNPPLSPSSPSSEERSRPAEAERVSQRIVNQAQWIADQIGGEVVVLDDQDRHLPFIERVARQLGGEVVAVGDRNSPFLQFLGHAAEQADNTNRESQTPRRFGPALPPGFRLPPSPTAFGPPPPQPQPEPEVDSLLQELNEMIDRLPDLDLENIDDGGFGQVRQDQERPGQTPPEDPEQASERHVDELFDLAWQGNEQGRQMPPEEVPLPLSDGDQAPRPPGAWPDDDEENEIREIFLPIRRGGLLTDLPDLLTGVVRLARGQWQDLPPHPDDPQAGPVPLYPAVDPVPDYPPLPPVPSYPGPHRCVGEECGCQS
jgi:hypothetical protein